MARLAKIGGAWLLIWLVTMAGGHAAGTVTVAVTERVTVTAANFTLADIATITGDDEAAISQLHQFRLGSSPPPGHSLTLTPNIITMRLAGGAIDLANITWQMPAVITVTTASQTIRGAVLTAQAVAAAQQKLTGMDSDIQPVTAQDIVLPVGTVDYQFIFPSGIRFNGPTTVLIPIQVNRQPCRPAVVKLNVSLYQNLVVTRRPFQQGEVITPADVALERRNVGQVGSYYTDLGKVTGQVVKHALAAGTVLNQSLVAMPQVIKRGDILSIVAHMGTIEVVTTGQALENGSVNDLIRVQNLQSKKILSGKVVDANTVEVSSAQ